MRARDGRLGSQNFKEGRANPKREGVAINARVQLRKN